MYKIANTLAATVAIVLFAALVAIFGKAMMGSADETVSGDDAVSWKTSSIERTMLAEATTVKTGL